MQTGLWYNLDMDSMKTSSGVVPRTSTTMLMELANSSESARWTEFVARYRPMMEAYMASHFPGVESEDVISETLIALIRALGDYRYDPEETGRFHNYLTGILRHRALSAVRVDGRRRDLVSAMEREASATGKDDGEETVYRESILKLAVAQFLSDRTIAPRTREVFRRTALAGESPEAVAMSLKMDRHAVDQAKSRSMAKVRELVKRLEAADDGR